MKETIVLTGATGFVGKKMALEILKKGYDLRVITRNIDKARKVLPLPCTFHEWDGNSDFPEGYLAGATALIHLAGEPIAENRWNNSVKNRIKKSRTEGTSFIIEALKKCNDGPKVVVGTSAIGIYGDRESEILNEDSAKGNGFLAEVCEKWEKAYGQPQARLVILRVGVVLGYGGALEKMLPPFRMGAGGKLASGKQWMSWIHRDDLVDLYLYALKTSDMNGTFNAVAPEAVTNSDFTKSLANALARPALFP
ncbi:MAG: TIGR01777 family protein, partial [Bdellovibrionales bacterium]|nr:TIGR01777 family protein [Bdellovibrionales bacterium]